MENLFINAREWKATASACDETITVADLIDILSNYDMDTPVYIRNADLTFSSFEECDILSDFDENKPSLLISDLLRDFNNIYNLLYDRDANGTTNGIQDDKDAYDKVDKKIVAGNWDLLRDFNMARGDMLVSDREVMAFALTLKKNGLISTL